MYKLHSRSRRIVLSATISIGFAGSDFAGAATVTWDAGGGGNLSWSLPANWTADTLPNSGGYLIRVLNSGQAPISVTCS